MVVLGVTNIFWGGMRYKKYENHCTRSLGSVIASHVFFLSLLHWWHSVIPLFPLRWCYPDCNTHFRMSGRQPKQDWALSLCQGKIALRWTNWSLSSTLHYLHHKPLIVWPTSCHLMYALIPCCDVFPWPFRGLRAHLPTFSPQFKIYFYGSTAEICGQGKDSHLHSFSTFSFRT